MHKSIRHFLFLIQPYLGLIFVYLVFLALAPASFHSLQNTKTFLTNAVIIGIGSLGMTMVIISGGIDLSVGSLVALGTVITALILKHWGVVHGADGSPVLGPGGDPVALTGGAFYALTIGAGLAAILACGFCGFVSGSAITGLRIVPFIVTLGMMQIVRGVSKYLAGSTMVNVPQNFLSQNLMVIAPQRGVWYSVAPGLWIMIALLIAAAILLKYTVFGRYIYAIGSNESTARLCGINVSRTRIGIYTLSGLLVGVASVMQFARIGQGDPTAAMGMELDIIAAVVIGGGSFNGGEGGAIGSIIGAIIIAILRNGCVQVGIENYVQDIIVGAIIITAVGIDRFKHSRTA